MDINDIRKLKVGSAKREQKILKRAAKLDKKPGRKTKVSAIKFADTLKVSPEDVRYLLVKTLYDKQEKGEDLRIGDQLSTSVDIGAKIVKKLFQLDAHILAIDTAVSPDEKLAKAKEVLIKHRELMLELQEVSHMFYACLEHILNTGKDLPVATIIPAMKDTMMGNKSEINVTDPILNVSIKIKDPDKKNEEEE